MAVIASLIVCLCCLVVPTTSNQQTLNCRTDKIDLLFVINGNKQFKEDISLEHQFVERLLNVFFSSEEQTLSRLRVSLVTYGKSEHTVTFEDFNKRKYLNEAISDAYTKMGGNGTGIFVQNEQLVYKKVLRTVIRAFRPNQGARSMARRVAVIVMSTEIKGENNMDDEAQNLREMGVIVFMIMINKFTKSQGTALNFLSGHTFQVNDFSTLIEDQTVPLFLCSDCYFNWFRFSSTENSDDTTGTSRVSCYAVKSHVPEVISWKDAMELCDRMNANLLAIETLEELRYVETRIHWEIQTSLKELYNHYRDIFLKMHIGLERDLHTLAKRFRWTNGRPVSVTHWDQESPNGGYVEACGIWKFDSALINSSTFHSLEWNFKDERELFEKTFKDIPNGWADVGCGERITPIYVCEASGEYNDTTFGGMMISPAKVPSIESALKRGEFRLDPDGALFSLPQFHQDTQGLKRSTKNTKFETVFNCDTDDKKHIAYINVCDHVKHCRNGRDENNCWYRRCDKNEFRCASGQCIPKSAKCDVYVDCYDGSDEADCLACNGKRCCDGSCLPAHWFFDGEIDCSGCSSPDVFTDENTDFISEPQDCPFVCNRTECVTAASLGDGKVDCTGPEGPLDESLGRLEIGGSCLTLRHKKLWAPKCVYTKDRYGSVLGCRDMSHLKDCQKFHCPEGYSKCPRAYCIPTHMVNDNILDCPFGEDEWHQANCAGNFHCYSRHTEDAICLHPDLVCDGHAHCPEGDDEANCFPKCMKGFLCQGGAVTSRKKERISLSDLSGIDPRTRYIDLSGNDLSVAFPPSVSGKLVNVFDFRCSDCNITSLDSVMEEASAQLVTVFTMDLSYNEIVEIKNNSIFVFTKNLHALNLSHNLLLHHLHDHCFDTHHASKVKLASLDLSYTALTSLRAPMFQILVRLLYLNLRGTKITRLDSNTLPAKMSLGYLDLRDTPLKHILPGTFAGVKIKNALYTDKFSVCCPQVRGGGIPEHKCHAPEATISSCSDLIGLGIQRALLFFVGLSALIGNIVVIVYRLLWGREILKKAYGVFVTQLAVSDLFMGVYLLFIGVADAKYRDQYAWKEQEWRMSLSCKIAGFLSSVSSETSIAFVFLITLDRYLVIKYPFGNVKFSKATTLLGCLGAWLFGVIIAAIPLLPAYEEWNIYSSSGMCVALPVSKKMSSGWGYSALVFVAFNFVLFLIIALGQLGIYKSLSSSKAPKCREQHVQDILVARQLAMVVLSDFLCWFPVGIIGIMAMNDHLIHVNIYSWLAILVLPINSALNPLLYTFPILMDKWERFKKGPNAVHSIHVVQMSTDCTSNTRKNRF